MNKLQIAEQFRRALQLFAATLTDEQALTVPTMYDYWEAGVAYGGKGQPSIVRRLIDGEDVLYRCRQAHTSVVGGEPEVYQAGWAVINVANAGTIDDPIPAEVGMEFTYGLYYLDAEDGNTYLCKREGEADGGTVVLYHLPHALVGQYFEVVA